MKWTRGQKRTLIVLAVYVALQFVIHLGLFVWEFVALSYGEKEGAWITNVIQILYALQQWPFLLTGAIVITGTAFLFGHFFAAPSDHYDRLRARAREHEKVEAGKRWLPPGAHVVVMAVLLVGGVACAVRPIKPHTEFCRANPQSPLCLPQPSPEPTPLPTPTPAPSAAPSPLPSPAGSPSPAAPPASPSPTPTPTSSPAWTCPLAPMPDCGASCCHEGGAPLFSREIAAAQQALFRARPEMFTDDGALRASTTEEAYTAALAEQLLALYPGLCARGGGKGSVSRDEIAVKRDNGMSQNVDVIVGATHSPWVGGVYTCSPASF